MFPDHNNFREAAHIGEELFDDQPYELERRCRSVQRGVEKNLFTREAALKAYGVSRLEYEEFLGKNMTKQLQLSVSADLTITIQDYGTIVHVMAKMFQALATLPHVGRLQHLDSAMREMG